jgi:pectinesterase
MNNTYGKGSQALALSAWADQQGYYGCGLSGYQDTLLAQIGNQAYGKCYIEGAVDFIFGQHAVAWFDQCDIRITAAGGAITADGRPSSSDPSYFVINKSSISTSGSFHRRDRLLLSGPPMDGVRTSCLPKYGSQLRDQQRGMGGVE